MFYVLLHLLTYLSLHHHPSSSIFLAYILKVVLDPGCIFVVVVSYLHLFQKKLDRIVVDG